MNRLDVEGGWRRLGRPGPKIGSPEPNSKASAREFAEQSGTTHPRVMRYLNAWNRAGCGGTPALGPLTTVTDSTSGSACPGLPVAGERP